MIILVHFSSTACNSSTDLDFIIGTVRNRRLLESGKKDPLPLSTFVHIALGLTVLADVRNRIQSTIHMALYTYLG